MIFCSISLPAQKFPYFAEIVNDTMGLMILRYHGKEYVKHLVKENRINWRCRSHYTGCRARITSCMHDGYVMVNKLDSAIIHTEHIRRKNAGRLK